MLSPALRATPGKVQIQRQPHSRSLNLQPTGTLEAPLPTLLSFVLLPELTEDQAGSRSAKLPGAAGSLFSPDPALPFALFPISSESCPLTHLSRGSGASVCSHGMGCGDAGKVGV